MPRITALQLFPIEFQQLFAFDLVFCFQHGAIDSVGNPAHRSSCRVKTILYYYSLKHRFPALDADNLYLLRVHNSPVAISLH